MCTVLHQPQQVFLIKSVLAVDWQSICQIKANEEVIEADQPS